MFRVHLFMVDTIRELLCFHVSENIRSWSPGADVIIKHNGCDGGCFLSFGKHLQ